MSTAARCHWGHQCWLIVFSFRTSFILLSLLLSLLVHCIYLRCRLLIAISANRLLLWISLQLSVCFRKNADAHSHCCHCHLYCRLIVDCCCPPQILLCWCRLLAIAPGSLFTWHHRALYGTSCYNATTTEAIPSPLHCWSCTDWFSIITVDCFVIEKNLMISPCQQRCCNTATTMPAMPLTCIACWLSSFLPLMLMRCAQPLWLPCHCFCTVTLLPQSVSCDAASWEMEIRRILGSNTNNRLGAAPYSDFSWILLLHIIVHVIVHIVIHDIIHCCLHHCCLHHSHPHRHCPRHCQCPSTFPRLEETNNSCSCLSQSNTQVEGAFFITLILNGTRVFSTWWWSLLWWTTRFWSIHRLILITNDCYLEAKFKHILVEFHFHQNSF